MSETLTPAAGEPGEALQGQVGTGPAPVAAAGPLTDVPGAGESATGQMLAIPTAEEPAAEAAQVLKPSGLESPAACDDTAPLPKGPYLPLRELLEGPAIPQPAQAERFANWVGLLRGQGFARRQVRQILWRVGQLRCVPPLTAQEFEEILGSGDGRPGEPGLPAAVGAMLAPGVDPADTEARREALMQPESFPWNSLGNAKRLVYMFGERLRYAQDERCWFLWNGRFWQRDEEMEICRLYRQMTDAMYVVASLIPPGQTPAEERKLGRLRKEFITWIHKSQSRKVEDDSIRQAQAEAAVSGNLADFDQDPDLLTVANGTLDLRTGALRPHAPADRIMRHIDIPYDPAADCPTWKAFLSAMMNNDPAMVAYLQKSLGYSMTADVREQCMFVCKGEGSNGKSTMLDVAMDVLGEYASPTDRNLLVLSRRDHPTSIYSLRNIRLAVASELDQDEYLSESLVKQMTGEREIPARGVGRDFERIPITWKIWLSTNHLPRLRGSDFGIRRRFRVIPFEVVFEAERDDKTLWAKLQAERAGILVWLVAGCLAWRREGLESPDKVRQATEAFFENQGRVGSFLGECVREHAGAHITAEQFYAFYSLWCERAGVPKHAVLSSTEFGERMAKKYTRKKCHGVRVYFDIAIPAEVAEALRNPGVPAAALRGEAGAAGMAAAAAPGPMRSPDDSPDGSEARSLGWLSTAPVRWTDRDLEWLQAETSRLAAMLSQLSSGPGPGGSGG